VGVSRVFPFSPFRKSCDSTAKDWAFYLYLLLHALRDPRSTLSYRQTPPDSLPRSKTLTQNSCLRVFDGFCRARPWPCPFFFQQSESPSTLFFPLRHHGQCFSTLIPFLCGLAASVSFLLSDAFISRVPHLHSILDSFPAYPLCISSKAPSFFPAVLP